MPWSLLVCRCRWGDYSGIALDPDGRTIWAFNAYSQTNNAWGTWLAAYQCNASTPLPGRRLNSLGSQHVNDSATSMKGSSKAHNNAALHTGAFSSLGGNGYGAEGEIGSNEASSLGCPPWESVM